MLDVFAVKVHMKDGHDRIFSHSTNYWTCKERADYYNQRGMPATVITVGTTPPENHPDYKKENR